MHGVPCEVVSWSGYLLAYGTFARLHLLDTDLVLTDMLCVLLQVQKEAACAVELLERH